MSVEYASGCVVWLPCLRRYHPSNTGEANTMEYVHNGPSKSGRRANFFMFVASRALAATLSPTWADILPGVRIRSAHKAWRFQSYADEKERQVSTRKAALCEMKEKVWLRGTFGFFFG